MATNINTILNWFITDLRPSQEQFWATLLSFRHKDDPIPQSAISNLSTTLNAKAEKAQFDAHKTSADAHQALFDLKQSLTDKGAQGGYAPLDEFTKLAAEYLNIVDDVVTGGSDALASAETVKTLNGYINTINGILFSDNVNMDTVQEIVDTIEGVQSYLDTILVDDFTTGGVTKAATAERVKVLKSLVDGLESSKVSIADLSQDIETDKASTVKAGSVKGIYDWAVGKFKTWVLDIETTASVNYTLPIADIKKKTVFTATNPIALNVPTNATEAIAIGTKKSFTVQGTGAVTVQGAGITFVQKNLVFTTGDTFTLEKIDTDTWAVNGNLPVAGAKVPYTVFIDTVNGVDATGVIEDKTKPFKTDTAAYAALPTDNGNVWTFYFIDNNVTRTLSQFPARKIMYVCYNTGTFDISAWTGLTTIGYLYFEIPYATLLHNSATQTRFTSSTPAYINANAINIQTVSHGTGSSFFQMSGLIRANLITQRNTSNKIFFDGELIVGTFDTTNTVLFSSGGNSNSKVNNLVLGGQSCAYGFVDGNLLIGKISGTGTLVIGLKNIDITGVSCPAGITVSLANGSCLTGVMSPNFLGGISFQPGLSLSIISDYKGRLNSFSSGAGWTINIAIYNSYIITPSVFFGASASTSSTLFLVVNSVIEQTTPAALFTGLSGSTPLTITKTGTFYSNATSLGSNVSIAASSLTSY